MLQKKLLCFIINDILYIKKEIEKKKKRKENDKFEYIDLLLWSK
jgi:hypothetical protein